MMQGGDPTGTGKGGDSIWGKPFADEFVGTYHHDKRGVLSMANSGTATNKSQFFITFRPVKRLDGKHTIFGHVVGGMETLAEIEQVETDTTDRPKEDVLFMAAEVFVDPFEEAQAQVDKEREEARKKERKQETPSTAANESILQKPKEFGSGVGKYINIEAMKKPNVPKRPVEEPFMGDEAPKKKKFLKTQLQINDFSGW